MATAAARAVFWFGQVDDSVVPEVGGKAARLAALWRAGVTVPPGFCVAASAYREFVAESGIARLIGDLDADLQTGLAPDELRDRAASLRSAIESSDLAPGLVAQLAAALGALGDRERSLFAVRSSATVEDDAQASFAGQLETYLGVPAEAIGSALKRCWASLWTERAIRYRQEQGIDQAGIAVPVLVQTMVPCDVAGVAFSRHPVTGADAVVVEATWGLGESLAQGEVGPDRYVLDKRTLAEAAPTHVGHKATRRVLGPAGGTLRAEVPAALREVPCLTRAQSARIARLALDLEERFGCPQDVEWGLVGDRLYVFQTRPVTVVAARSVFTEDCPADTCWTSGFLEERFPEPLSPLGWSVVRESFEAFAIRDPLRYLGCADLDELPLTRLYHGHPYVNVEVFRRLYKLFPDALLPEDAWRYFPGGDTSARRRAKRPSSLLDPRLLGSLLTALLQDPGNWSPLHNHVLWARFVPGYDRAIAEIEGKLGRGDALDLGAVLAAAASVDEVNGRLLRIHRWSLTHADLLYTLLRRLGRLWLGPAYSTICSNLVSHLSDRSLEMDTALHRLVDQARRSPRIAAALRTAATLEELAARLSGEPAGEAFLAAVERFLARYGHRSFSLDILHPSYSAAPSRLVWLLRSLLDGGAPRAQQERRDAAFWAARRAIFAAPWDFARWSVFERVLTLTQTYVRLREDQRFHWQKGLATLRRLYLLAGERLAAAGALARTDDVFFLLKREVEAFARGEVSAADLRSQVAGRRAEHARLDAEYRASPRRSYPRFLCGDEPLRQGDEERVPGEALRGHPVSPGQARGPVKIVRTPDELPTLEAGAILVTRGADPGWTPLFGKIGGLVMEAGGQLSHGSVVAREYGIPAVVGIANATEILRDGDVVLVDGEAGSVSRLVSAV